MECCLMFTPVLSPLQKCDQFLRVAIDINIYPTIDSYNQDNPGIKATFYQFN